MKYIKQCAIKTFQSVNNKERNGNNKISAVLFHQVNCQGKMAAGIGKAIKQQYPQHYEDYLLELSPLHINTTCTINEVAFGSFVETTVEGEDLLSHGGDYKLIVGLFGQFYYGRDKRQTNYAALIHAIVLWFRSTLMVDFSETQFIVPKGVGCGLAGGDWKLVELLLKEVEDMFNIEFTICEI